MGKRSKTAKQKAARSAQRLSKTLAQRLSVSASSSNNLVKGGTSKSAKLLRSLQRRQEKKQTVARRSAEDQEFARQQASLMERERVIDWKRNQRKTTNSKMEMQPASFAATDQEKSTKQLLDETVETVAGWGGVQSTTTQRVLVASLPRWSSEAHHGESAESNNPWAVLDDDEEDKEVPTQPPAPALVFAPASFSMAPSSAEIDPDL